jgi:hypothetical protein
MSGFAHHQGIGYFKPKIPLLIDLECLEMENFDMFYENIVYFVVIWYSFPRFGTLCQEKIWQPGRPSSTIQQ